MSVKEGVINILDELGFVIFTKKTIKSYKVAQMENVHPLLNGKGDLLKAK